MSSTPRPRALAIVAGLACSLHAFAAPVIPGQAAGDDWTLDLRAATVDTSRTMDDLERRAGARGRFVVQLDGPMTPDRLARLTDAGVQVGEYLPPFAFHVNFARADRDMLAAIDFVRWHAPYTPAWKIDPEVGTRLYVTDELRQVVNAGRRPLVVTLFPDASHAEASDAIMALGNVQVHLVHFLGRSALMHVSAPEQLINAIAGVDAVQFLEPAPEITSRNSTNRWIVQSNVNGSFPLYDNGLRGEGQIVGVLDGRVDESHCSFDDTAPIGPTHRKIVAYNSSEGAEFHGTHVAGTAVGDNGVDNDTRGVAYMGKLAFNTVPSFNDAAIYGRLSLHSGQGARLHTNSWGNDGTTSYDSLARGLDRFQYDFEDDLVLLAVTNTSTLRNPENAKNLLACGASQDTPNQGNHCSGGTGPTADGRRKPELYAPGCGTQSASSGSACSTTGATGTSMATPALAGTGMLVRQYYTEGYYPTGVATSVDSLVPTSALIKATMLNSATDMTGVSGYPSNREGWGRVRADDALAFPGDTRLMLVEDLRNADGLSTGEFRDIPITVTGSGEQLRVTVVWTDAPATAGAGSPVINDLDVQLISPTNAVYLGNVFSGGVSVTGGSADAINNVEQVHVSSPETGAWILRVSGASVNQGTQGFAAITTGDIQPGSLGVRIVLNNGAPDIVAPDAAVTFPLTITTGEDTLVPGSPTLHYNYGAGWLTTPIVSLGGTAYEATLPGADCSETPLFYVAAEGTTTGVITVPNDGAADPFSASVGEIQALVDLDFESGDGGWVVGSADDDATTGIWTLVDPNGTGAQPGDDHSSPGTQCWVTGQGSIGGSLGEQDVDGGLTTLTTASFDLTGAPDAMLSYWRWYSNDTGASPGADVFVIDISNDDGATWVNVETVGPSGPGTAGGWIFHEFDPRTVVSASSQMKLRFVASDEGAGSVVEAAIDDFRITEFVCDDDCIADWNGDGVVNTSDFIAYLNDYNAVAGGGTPTFGNPDLADPTGVLNTSDFIAFLNAFSAGC